MKKMHVGAPMSAQEMSSNDIGAGHTRIHEALGTSVAILYNLNNLINNHYYLSIVTLDCTY